MPKRKNDEASSSKENKTPPTKKPKTTSTWADHELLAEMEDLPVEKSKSFVELFEEDFSVVFLCRYRRNLIGADMTPERLFGIRRSYQEVLNVRQKATTVIKAIEKANKLDPEVERSILAAKSVDDIEHLYAPFKEKKGTLYQKAVDLGLADISMKIVNERTSVKKLESCVEPRTEGLETVGKVQEGVRNIISHTIAKNPLVLEKVKELLEKHKIVLQSKASKSKAKKEEEQAQKFEIYLDFSCPVKYLKPHQVLAINRGESLKVLSVHIDIHEFFQRDLRLFCSSLLMKNPDPQCQKLFHEAFEDAYSKRIYPLVCRQIRSKLTRHAENESIKVFADNLKQLLLMAPSKGEKILGVDPGFSNGCKCALISESGELLETLKVWPHSRNASQRLQSERDLANLMQKHACHLIALGNGTACRETETWITTLIAGGRLPAETRYAIVSEQGASIYSCSPQAKKEFDDLDVNLISACSIARRLNDPLAELVKLDPKNLGVGQYQHDMNQKELQESLKEVVVECVSTVGVDLNTASVDLLKHVAGLTETRASQIVTRRNEKLFQSREELRKVRLIGPKTFTQCAGFVVIDPRSAKISNTKRYNILDSTTVHPESYELAEKLVKDAGLNLQELGSERFRAGISKFRSSATPESLEKKYKEPKETIETVLESLQKELFHDFRLERPDNKPIFKKSLQKMTDLKTGDVVSGRVSNRTDFGAFVDIGVECDGLIHVSQMQGRTLKVGDIVQSTILSVDAPRKRIGLRLNLI